MRNMKNINYYMFFLFFSLFFSSCEDNKKFETEQQMVSYIEDENNGLSLNKNINDVEFKISFQPTDLIVSRYLKGREYGYSEVDSLRSKLSGFLYFKLGISKNGRPLLGVKENEKSFSRLTNKLAFGMLNSVLVRDGYGEKQNLYDYSFVRSYGYGKYSNFLLIFEKKKLERRNRNFTS